MRGVKSEGAFSEKVLMVKEAQCAGGLYRTSERDQGSWLLSLASHLHPHWLP